MRVPIARLVTAGILVLAVAAPASAGSGRVEITVDANFVTRVETFTADGAFCPAGTAVTPGVGFAGSGRAVTFHLQKILTCADGSGSLTILVNAATVDGWSGDLGGWSVVAGTGAWASTRGGGMLRGDYYPDVVIDHYAGRLTN